MSKSETEACREMVRLVLLNLFAMLIAMMKIVMIVQIVQLVHAKLAILINNCLNCSHNHACDECKIGSYLNNEYICTKCMIPANNA